MNHFGHFETALYHAHPEYDLTIRNLCYEGDTPGFRPHAGRNTYWAFPGADKFHPAIVKNTGLGVYAYPDEWLTQLKTDTVIAFFGFSSSFKGAAGLENYKQELAAFIQHTQSQSYNGEHSPQLILASPTAFQDLSGKYHTPDGKDANANLAIYTEAMQEVASDHKIPFIDLFTPSKALFENTSTQLTTDGALLNDAGYQWLTKELSNSLIGHTAERPSAVSQQEIRTHVNEKNWCWLNDYKVSNGIHVYGQRYKPYGEFNYPFEIKKTREMTANRDRAIWHALKGKPYDLSAADQQTSPLPKVKTNYKASNKNGTITYKDTDQSVEKFTLAEGYRIELFASEQTFKDLANPSQIAFDNQGRLWVATMPSYPHYKIGDPKPSDKLIILEDTDGDGKADKQTTFADDLHMPTGFELATEGVYVAQNGSLVLLKDTDGNDQYDVKEVLHSGYDNHDSHHAISAFCADPSGAIIMGEGLFIHSNIETVYGTIRGTNGGFFRYNPARKKLSRHGQMYTPNPWGSAYDDYGQPFYLHTSFTHTSWMTPGLVKPQYGYSMPTRSILTSHKVRPTSGLEIISSRHFPDNVQGDLLINNTIGYRGAKQHQLIEEGTGFTTKYRQDLFKSSDKNFRPSDLEFAPDGSLYISDWHNALIGHMQHNARDPHRDRIHGRIYRLTYPSRPLIEPADIHGASITTLLENLTLPESRSRYRTRRELRGRNAEEVMPILSQWAAQQTNEHHQLEALWVSWGLDRVDGELLKKLLKSPDHRIRAAATHTLRFNTHQVPDYLPLFQSAAADSHGRVRLEAIIAASWLENDEAAAILQVAQEHPIDDYIKNSYTLALQHSQNKQLTLATKKEKLETHLTGKQLKLFTMGKEVFHREAHCATCHQEKGEGLPEAGFPPIAGTKWILGNPDRLIKLTLHGLHGPITVKGKAYPGHVPMTAFKGILNDKEIAAVLTYARNAMGNKASVISPEKVKQVRQASKDQDGFYRPADLLKEYPN